MPFTLPSPLPGTAAELGALREQARAEIRVFQARHKAGEKLGSADRGRLSELLDAVDTISEELTDVADEAASEAEDLVALLSRAEAEAEQVADTAELVEDIAEEVAEEVTDVVADEPVGASARRRQRARARRQAARTKRRATLASKGTKARVKAQDEGEAAPDDAEEIAEDIVEVVDEQVDHLEEVADLLDQAVEEATSTAADEGLVALLTEAAAEADAAVEEAQVVEDLADDLSDEVDDEPGLPEARVANRANRRAAARVIARAVRKAPRKGTGRPNFRGLGGKPPARSGPAWEMHPSCPNYQPGHVGFKQIALALDAVRPGSRAAFRPNRPNRTMDDGREYARQVVAMISRNMKPVEDSHGLVAAIEEATDESRLPGGSLTAAGGWCAPSEQLYDFCDTPAASDLISVPEITISRGGVRWPAEPDFSELFRDFGWFFTEEELAATDADGNPTAIKKCVEIPCPDEFEELRLAAMGYCVEAGILQAQGWPELIEKFMRELAEEHLRAISRRTIADIVAKSGDPKEIPPTTVLGASSSVLNSLALIAFNVRRKRRLGYTSTIEGIAPTWLFEVLRADLANQEGLGVKSVSDSQLQGWLSDRNIALQFVGDWQTDDDGLPGDLDLVTWPETVDVVLFQPGTFFRALSNIIELGAMYPKEQLQVNRFTRLFTEDAYALGKRCGVSVIARIPLCVSGAIGARQSVDCNADRALG